MQVVPRECGPRVTRRHFAVDAKLVIVELFASCESDANED